MTKADIVNEIAKSTGAEKVQVQAIVEAFMESIKGSLEKKNNVYLRGFGSFIVKKRATKVARNISKNTTITIPAHDIPAFKPAKSFAAKVKEGRTGSKLKVKPLNLQLCRTERSISVIRWLRTSGRNVCARTVIRKSSTLMY